MRAFSVVSRQSSVRLHRSITSIRVTWKKSHHQDNETTAAIGSVVAKDTVFYIGTYISLLRIAPTLCGDCYNSDMTESKNIRPAASGRIQRLALSCAMISIHTSEAFSLTRQTAFMPRSTVRSVHSPSRLFLFAPPGSGYASRDEEKSELPDSYEPMMEYPGTMRPGRTPENSPFHDLPIADDDPDPVPWPHFNQIEWHHQWAPPHPHPIPMEEFIEQNGRWATPEMEAAMRAGVRRDVRQRQEMEEEQKRETLIMDDDDDDETDEPQDLGEGMFGQLGSDADQAITAKAVAPPVEGAELEVVVDDEEDEVIEEEGGSFDDFLLDLGLDGDDDEEDVDEDVVEEDDKAMVASKRKPKPAPVPVPVPVVEATPRKAAPRARLEDVVESDDDGDEDDDDIETNESDTTGGATASINVDEDDDLDLGLDDDDEISGNDGVSTVPLEDFSDGDDLGTDDFFSDGGFDYDGGDIGDSDGGDSW